MKKQYLYISIIFLFFNGCSAAFVPYTNDPQKKIEWALHLTSVERPLAARRFLLDVQENMNRNDKNMTAHFNRANAYMISSKEYQKYRANNPSWNTNIDGGPFKSEKLYLQSVDMFTELEFYYEASNASWLLSKLYKNIGRHNQQCKAIDDSKKLHMLGKSKDPQKGKGVIAEKNGTPFEEYLDNLARDNNCIKQL